MKYPQNFNDFGPDDVAVLSDIPAVKQMCYFLFAGIQDVWIKTKKNAKSEHFQSTV